MPQISLSLAIRYHVALIGFSLFGLLPHAAQAGVSGRRNILLFFLMITPSRAPLLTGQYSHLNGVPVLN
jgi:hypothetical protein